MEKEEEKEKDVYVFNGLSRLRKRKPWFLLCALENVNSRDRKDFCPRRHSSRTKVNSGILSTDE